MGQHQRDGRVVEPDTSEERHLQRTRKRGLLGALTGFLVGASVGWVAGAINLETAGAIAACGLAGAIAGTALGTFIGGMSSLESPDPGNEPSETTHPIRDVPELTSEEHTEDTFAERHDAPPR